jgi:hypothetical protein
MIAKPHRSIENIDFFLNLADFSMCSLCDYVVNFYVLIDFNCNYFFKLTVNYLKHFTPISTI